VRSGERANQPFALDFRRATHVQCRFHGNVSHQALAPVVALISYVLLHWQGAAMIQDGWALWQGAVSLATGHGYTYFSDNLIIAWPPLYPAYLSAATLLLGPTGWSLLVADAILITLQAYFWKCCATMIARDSKLAVPIRPSLLLSVFIGLFVAVHQTQVFAHNLLYALLPLFLLALWKLVRDAEVTVGARNFVSVVCLGTALMLTHNTSIAFVISAAAVVAWNRRPDVTRSMLAALVVAGIPLSIWALTRTAFGQAGSHHVGWDAGKYDAMSYALQLLEGSGKLLVPDRAHLPFLAIVILWISVLLLARSHTARGLRFSAVFVLCSSAVLFALFNLTWVYNALDSSRFLLFVVLALVPFVYLHAVAKASRVAGVAIVVLLVPQVYWTVVWIHTQHTASLAELGFPKDLVPPSAYISRAYLSGPPVQSGLGTLVAPVIQEEPRGRRQ
jgi:hypothetical protein